MDGMKNGDPDDALMLESGLDSWNLAQTNCSEGEPSPECDFNGPAPPSAFRATIINYNSSGPFVQVGDELVSDAAWITIDGMTSQYRKIAKYQVEIELRRLRDPFTGVATHSSGWTAVSAGPSVQFNASVLCDQLHRGNSLNPYKVAGRLNVLWPQCWRDGQFVQWGITNGYWKEFDAPLFYVPPPRYWRFLPFTPLLQTGHIVSGNLDLLQVRDGQRVGIQSDKITVGSMIYDAIELHFTVKDTFARQIKTILDLVRPTGPKIGMRMDLQYSDGVTWSGLPPLQDRPPNGALFSFDSRGATLQEMLDNVNTGRGIRYRFRALSVTGPFQLDLDYFSTEGLISTVID